MNIIEEKISKVNGEIAIKRYNKGKMLGKGGFAKVYEVTNLESKKTLAGKIIAKSSLTKTRARQKVWIFNIFLCCFYEIEKFKFFLADFWDKNSQIPSPSKYCEFRTCVRRSGKCLHIIGDVFESSKITTKNNFIFKFLNKQTLNELLKRRKKLYEIEVQCYVMQIISALKYLHSVRVIHREYYFIYFK